MRILDMVGAKIKSWLSTKNNDVSKDAILSLIDNNIAALDAFISVYDDNEAIIGRCHDLIAKKQSQNKYDRQLQTFYGQFHQKLMPSARSLEAIRFFKSIRETAERLRNDHEHLSSHFAQVFAGTSTKTIPLRELKVSSGVAIGFLIQTRTLIWWATYFIFHVSLGERTIAPKYQLEYVKSYMDEVIQVVNYITGRSRSETILSIIADLKNRHADIFVVTDDRTIDTYLSDNELASGQLVGMSGFMRSPLLMIGDFIAGRGRKEYEANKALREWMQTKISVMQMDLDGVDTASEEYQRQVKILQHYTDRITQLDREIARYEAD